MGDFNETVNTREKFGGKVYNSRTSFLGEFIHRVGALDLGCSSKGFTWENRQEGSA